MERAKERRKVKQKLEPKIVQTIEFRVQLEKTKPETGNEEERKKVSHNKKKHDTESSKN